MVRADGVAMTAVGLFARAALGFVGLSILIAWACPPPGPSATAATPPGDPSPAGTTVTLRVPDGALAKHLRVVDATGRELIDLTYWVSGSTTVVSGRRDGAGVSYHLNDDGSASLLVEGTARAARIETRRDGTTRVTDRLEIGIFPRVDDRDGSPPPGLDTPASDRTQCQSGIESPDRFRQGLATRVVDPHGG